VAPTFVTETTIKHGNLLAGLLGSIISLALAGCSGGGSSTSANGGISGGGAGGPTTPPPSTAMNRPPTISGTPASTAKVGVAYSFQPTASDPDGDQLVFEVRAKPAWATFDAATGSLSGTPPEGAAGTFTGIQIVVSDAKSTASLAPFDLVVAAAAIGSATLTWQPPTLNEDGSALTDLAGYVIRYGQNAATLEKQLKLDNTGLTTYVIENLTGGTWFFSLAAVNRNGMESRPTRVVSKTIS